MLDPNARRALRDLSARLALARGEADAAGRLFAANEDWRSLAGVVREHAVGFTAYGRHAALRDLIDLAPPAVRDRDPWLTFWRGWCRMADQEDGWRTPLERAFERFHRVLGTGVEGCGLGLAIVREIAQSHGGDARLTSCAHGAGTVVRITLPMAA